MTEPDEPAEWTQYDRLGQLRHSLSNLVELGHVDSIGVGAVINTGMVLLGAGVFWMFDGIIAGVGAVWALLHVAAIVKGVVEA